MRSVTNSLADFLADVVMTGYYLAEPAHHQVPSLHDAEMKCLKIISTFGPLQMHSLAQCMHVTKPRATQLVDSLLTLGLVERTQGSDKRITLVNATEQGNQIVADVRIKYLELAERIEDRLGLERTELLVELLGDITPLSSTTLEHVTARKGSKK